MTDIRIPPAALDAGARAIKNLFVNDCPATYDEIARAAFVAMVTAWEGMWPDRFDGVDTICLPLTEKQDDKA